MEGRLRGGRLEEGTRAMGAGAGVGVSMQIVPCGNLGLWNSVYGSVLVIPVRHEETLPDSSAATLSCNLNDVPTVQAISGSAHSTGAS